MSKADLYQLKDYQVVGRDWLAPRERACLWDEAGLGKTRQIFAAYPTLTDITVVTPAAIRDAKVWQDELVRVGHPARLEVYSYHELARRGLDLAKTERSLLVFDESQRLKGRKSSWFKPAEKLANNSARVVEASGTPVPNIATELWAQLRLIRPMPAYWKWVERWFVIRPGRHSMYEVDGTLLGCAAARCEPGTDDCAHWDEFFQEHYDGWVLRRLRDDVLKDLPPMTGQDHAIWTPLTPTQRRAYKELGKTFLAEIPEEGISIEALSSSEKYAKLMQMASGLSIADPSIDDKHSSKLALTEELLSDRSQPTLVAAYYRNSAAALERTCTRMNLKYATIGALKTTSKTARARIVKQFQGGDLDVLIGSLNVISEGLTLTAADEVLMFERSDRPDVNEQVIRRIHRIGQSRPVTVRQLVSPKTFDETQWNRNARKDRHIKQTLSRAELASALSG